MLMKKTTIALYLILLPFISFSQIPFIKNLDKGINQKIECSCIDKDENLTVAYYESPLKETLIFDKWDISLNKWIRKINTISSVRMEYRNFNKCIYKGDSLLLITAYRDGSINRTGLFYIPNNINFKPQKMSDFRSLKGGEVFISDTKIIHRKLILLGRFDTIINTQSKIRYAYSNAVIFEYEDITDNWGFKASGQIKNFTIANLSAAINDNSDTAIIIASDNSPIILRYIFPDKLEPILKSNSNLPYSSVAFIDKKWLITFVNSDSVIYSSNTKDFFGKKLDKKLGYYVSIINTPKGILIAEDNAQISRIYKLDLSLNKLANIYQSPPSFGSLPLSGLINSNTSLFYHTNIPILFRNKIFGNIVELNLDFDRTIKFIPVTAYIFYDKNNNFKKDIDEDLVSGKILNRTYNYFLTSTTGKFEDNVPYYNDVEYELVSNNYGQCLKLPFSGALKSNTLLGTNSDLYFPLQSALFPKNINVKSWGTATARLMDTIPLAITISNHDCNINPSNASVILVLDSNTTLINSSPAYNFKNGNTIYYNLTNIKANRDSVIKLNILYPYSKYKIGEYVKHYVNMFTAYKDDTLDNNDSIVQKMVYSYDPNAKYSIPQGTITSDLKNIRYYIEFQNEGNDVARRVVIMDTLDTKIPVYEFQMVASSHAYKVSLQNNVVTWEFDNINLPPKSLDLKGSQGYVIFDAHIISNVGVGDSIRNKAFIYFDFNEPIVTNLAIIKRIEDLPFVDENENTFRVFPNPAMEIVTIENKININQNIKIYNMLGQEIMDVKLDPIGKTMQSISSWPRGMYFIKSSKGGFQKFLVH